MFLKDSSLNKVYPFLLVSLLSLSAFLVLIIFRSADDNRLTSWQWTFADVDIRRIFFILLFGFVIAYVLSRFSFYERRPILFLILFSFAASAVFWREPEVIVDASRYFTQAKHLKLYGIKYFFWQWGRDIQVWTDLPLIPFLYGLIFKFFGESRIYIQIFTGFLFSMTCVTTCLIGKTLWDKNVGFFAGLLILGIPCLLTQVPLMLVDVPTMFFFTFSIFTFIKAIEKGRVYILLSSISIFLAFYSKYSAWLMCSVLVIIFLVYLKNPAATQRAVLQRGIAVAYISGILILVFILLKFDVFSEQIKFLLEYQKPGLRRWGESFLSSFLYQMHPFITIAALYSFFAAFKRKDLRYIIICWLIILVVMLQIRRSRYIMVMLPMFVLMASYGLQIIKTIELRRFIVFSIVAFSLVVAIFTYLPFLQTMSLVNIKDAGRFLNSIDEVNIEVFTLPSKDTIVNQAVGVPILDIFTEKEIYYNYDAVVSFSSEEINTSSLRFTWEYKNPEYYVSGEEGLKGNTAVAVISNGLYEELPEEIEQKLKVRLRRKGYKKIKVFKKSSGVFRYSPFVTVYQYERNVF